jgi:hypothetical protein
MLSQITEPVKISVNYGLDLIPAISGNGFTMFRMQPLTQSDINFSPRSTEVRSIWAHFYQVPDGYELTSVPWLMQDAAEKGRKLRAPKDIREILALGPRMLARQEHHLAIIAPDLVEPDLENLILKLHRYPEWMGLIPNTWDPPHDSFDQFEFVAFSDDVS